ncbi:DUF3120 domain-containing protein [Pseudanabaena sp. FACHB-2040]|uniref:DUF3120 domain-containing protein n=1 Tax=Pseudanabaena sp. FACHB-2040 TaxID=2692859 RepID=UPI001688F2BA|nr:DUF3120 domain-containing protein [Pseudanabaena sp. FACHB-2040]MBD2259026.1 DUF3120 domain-containing protein [Pseudanabaena sp. FACHB-2040]
MTPLKGSLLRGWFDLTSRQVQVLAAAVGLVVLPVFFQAPLVRVFPWLSLALTGAWLGLGLWLMQRPRGRVWGDLLVGFTWTWLAGSLYWGWLRWEPMVHLPVEALALPIVVLCLRRGWGRVGGYFYLGSLLGTAVTDLYTNWMGLFPSWRQLMAVDPEFVPVVLREAAGLLGTPVAGYRAAFLVFFLISAGVIPLLYSRQLIWWAFGGAVLSTLLVDGLFFLSAALA